MERLSGGSGAVDGLRAWCPTGHQGSLDARQFVVLVLRKRKQGPSRCAASAQTAHPPSPATSVPRPRIAGGPERSGVAVHV